MNQFGNFSGTDVGEVYIVIKVRRVRGKELCEVDDEQVIGRADFPCGLVVAIKPGTDGR